MTHSGQIKKGEVRNPKGRPRLSGDIRREFNRYVDPYKPDLFETGIKMALNGNPRMLELFISRFSPKPPKDEYDEALVDAQINSLIVRAATDEKLLDRIETLWKERHKK